ncbi:arsenite methyltransferase-like [Leucoraja erinacea]|uniref:arsenite methyltransferase-like n=1 Tax=Leucoraja erinaceus TaxID=7782 RepID=UPI00245905DF|nr:arsenite methyltransferase-like [Leucoraja erinacea]
MFAEWFSRQLAKPTHSLLGWVAKKLFERNNRFLEESAVKLCDIQPGNVVLELGFGPGLGLQEAARRLTQPGGKLYGLDISEYMYNTASERLQADIQSGKVTLFLGSVEQIPLADNAVDKVYHCNCYYFWPDLRAGSREIHRVMKPGALMVTTLHLEALQRVVASGVLKDTNWQPELYMEALSETGFVDVRMEEQQDNERSFKAVFATANKA